MMSESKRHDEPENEPSGEDDRDELVGRYTEVEGDGPLVRGRAGEYTHTDRQAAHESVVGDYVSTQEHPHTHDPSERQGKYTRADHGEPHPHKHHE
jgi:hypothetical protein